MKINDIFVYQNNKDTMSSFDFKGVNYLDSTDLEISQVVFKSNDRIYCDNILLEIKDVFKLKKKGKLGQLSWYLYFSHQR